MYIKLLLYAKVARVQALAMSVLPCVLAYFWVYPKIVSFRIFILVCVSLILFHLSVNTISEYRDCVNGIDDSKSPGTKYRLITGIVPEKHILYIGVTAFIIASTFGILACFTYPALLIPGLIGAGLTLFYSEWIGLKYRGLGELSVFLGYGLLLGFSTVYSATGACTISDVLVFIPGSLFIVCVLLANNIRDFDFDKKRTVTLTTIVGKKISYFILYALATLGYVMYTILSYYKILPRSTYCILTSLPVLLVSIKYKMHPKFINFFGIIFFITEIMAILSIAWR